MAPTNRGGATTFYMGNFHKYARKMKTKLTERALPKFVCVDPPLQADIITIYFTIHNTHRPSVGTDVIFRVATQLTLHILQATYISV